MAPLHLVHVDLMSWDRIKNLPSFSGSVKRGTDAIRVRFYDEFATASSTSGLVISLFLISGSVSTCTYDTGVRPARRAQRHAPQKANWT